MAVPAAVAAAAEVIEKALDVIVACYMLIDQIRMAGERVLGPETLNLMGAPDLEE